MSTRLTPEILLRAYAHGVFPMADARDDPDIFFVDPEWRGVIPLNGFHIPRRLARTVRNDTFEVRINTRFADIVHLCAQSGPKREGTWINATIERLYTDLHAAGHAHSVECWDGETLVGGLYGVSLKGAFFGESMVSLRRDASKIALVHLVARLIAGGYCLLDTQFTTPHLEQFGTLEINRVEYHDRLQDALGVEADFFAVPQRSSGAAALQSITQTS